MIACCSTLTHFAMGHPDIWGAWLYNAEAMQASHPDVRFFCAIETDARGLAPFAPLMSRLDDVGGEWWTYHLDDGRSKVTTENRGRHLVCGQNLATDYATSIGATHVVFLAADCEPPPDTIPKLLEVNWPIVGGHVPGYCLDGPDVIGYDFPVKRHMATAAFVMLQRSIFRSIRWRWDIDLGLTDDPCLYWDAKRLYGVDTYVRHDVVGRHYPEALCGIEERGYDLSVAQ
jgi:hypothetical protein